MVRDINTTMDRLATLSQFQAPNVRRCRGNYPVYGMGQPTKDGLTSIIQGLKEEGHQVKSIDSKIRKIACLSQDGHFSDISNDTCNDDNGFS